MQVADLGEWYVTDKWTGAMEELGVHDPSRYRRS